MDAPGSSLREAIERIALAGLGAASLTADRAEELADALVERGLVRREVVREVIDELRGRWRNETARIGEKAGEGLQTMLAGLGVGATLRDVRVEELELKVAQLEHRLRLVESGPATAAAGPAAAAEGAAAETQEATDPPA